MKDENRIKLKVLREIPRQHQGVKWKDSHLLLSWKHRLFQPKLAPLGDQPMKGLVDAELNAWDNSSASRADWDAMVDSYEERGS